MGMAAGQARLLSITSRMSDNELRAQIINNNKMRLATESSQVSEAYIAALNQAQLMFTSYDKDNNSSYQKLSFNALTAYNPYNNQYALTNTGGQVLLSEIDTRNYEANRNNLDGFLRAYGLENTTTYFNKLQNYMTVVDDMLVLPYKTGMYNADGTEIMGYFGTDETALPENISEYLKILYEGGNTEGVNHLGYDNSIASSTYYNYSKYSTELYNSLADYNSAMYEIMLKEFDVIIKNEFGGSDSYKDLSSLKSKVNEAGDMSTMSGIMGHISNIIGTMNSTDYGVSDPSHSYFASLKQIIDENKGESVNKNYNNAGTDPAYTYAFDGNHLNIFASDAETTTPFIIIDLDASNNPTGISGGSILDGKKENTSTSFDAATRTLKWTDESNVEHSLIINSLSITTGTPKTASFNLTESYDNTLENMKEVSLSVLNSLTKAISNSWDATIPYWWSKNEGETGNMWENVCKFANELAGIFFDNVHMFDLNSAKNGYANEADIPTVNVDGTNRKLTPADLLDFWLIWSMPQTQKENAQVIYDVTLLDCVMDTYGEPKFAWVDLNNPNENGEAKAKWYTNLFELIEKNGYKTLLDGIASSTEWMQFAFENGIVQMKQVDEHNAWNNIIYSNCSDITEQTDDKAIAIAEAEYNAAMNKIENKDKRYDLELKNIDTEHNSLQTEYDSIKAAIDKNIERNFKLYS